MLRGGTANSVGLYNYIIGVGAGHKYGIQNYVYQIASQNRTTYGIQNILKGGVGNTFGLHSTIQSVGIGNKYNLWLVSSEPTGTSRTTDIFGVFNTVNGAADAELAGMVNVVNKSNQSNTHRKMGVYNIVSGGNVTSDSSMYGTLNSLIPFDGVNDNARAIGTYNHIDKYGTNDKYGTLSIVEKTNNANGKVYGNFSYAASESSSTGGTGKSYGVYGHATAYGSNAEAYGVYGKVEGTAGEKWAGYFEGDIYAASATYYGSDSRIKDNVRGLNSAIQIISELRPVTYDFNADILSSQSSEKQYGLIAQEVQRVLPEVTKETTIPGKPIYQEIKTSVGDVSNNIVTIEGYEPDENILSVNYNAFIPILIKAVQEQQETIEALEKRVEELENR